MQALILAAGMGRRLGEFTSENTKCMLEVNGVRLIDRMLQQLDSLPLNRIIIVVGYAADNLKKYISQNHSEKNIIFIENPIYDKTNNIYSLWLAGDLMKEDDTLLLESDLIVDDKVIRAAYESDYPNVALVSKYQTWNDGTMVRIDNDCTIVNFIPKKAFKYSETEFYYKTVNIYKFSKEFILNIYLPFLDAYIKVLGENEYYEQVLRVITLIDSCDLKALPITGMNWYEIDDVQDLRIAETIFAEPKDRLQKMQNSYGGYWRYPSVLDFCYLVNPYFPQPKMLDEMKANFDALLCNYPSGMGVNSLLAAKYFGLNAELVVVGNGAAEIIRSLMSSIEGKVGVIYPTFEEYPNRLSNDKIVKFTPNNPDFSYTEDDVIKYFTSNPVDCLLIINPDNPSGNLIKRTGLNKLTEWARENNIRLIIDESFIDFADNAEQITLLNNEFLRKNPSLCVVKSISKSYGVPGLRLGILASADQNLIKELKKDLAIWNINSFAEFYMQIFNKYEKDYTRACEKFRAERELFRQELEQIPWLRVIPSQANYFLCELTGISSADLALKLMTDHNILIKDCSSKKGFGSDGRQYVRIAIRDRHDNTKLVSALKSL